MSGPKKKRYFKKKDSTNKSRGDQRGERERRMCGVSNKNIGPSNFGEGT